MDAISLSQFEEMTGLDRRHIARGLKRLATRKIIIKTDDTHIVQYGFNKKWQEWDRKSADRASGAYPGTSAYSGMGVVPNQVPLLVPNQAPTKKRIYTKKGKFSSDQAGEANPIARAIEHVRQRGDY